jgi:GntR family transcriptional regulator
MTSIFHVTPDDPLPLYAQLEREIKLAVVLGTLKIGDQLPTVRQLAVDLRVNANTVARVYAELEREGLLSTRRGIGTFVQAMPSTPATLSLSKRREELHLLVERFISEATARGFTLRELQEQIHQIFTFPTEKSHVT